MISSYLNWAQTLTPDQRLNLWFASGLLVYVYVLIYFLWPSGEAADDGPSDPDLPLY